MVYLTKIFSDNASLQEEKFQETYKTNALALIKRVINVYECACQQSHIIKFVHGFLNLFAGQVAINNGAHPPFYSSLLVLGLDLCEATTQLFQDSKVFNKLSNKVPSIESSISLTNTDERYS